MREIKFRAWDVIFKTMLSWDVLKKYEVEHIDTATKQKTGIKLMQFTGLKDRNGKEIYELDVLKITDDTDEFITNGTVEWLHDFWNVSGIEDSLYQLRQRGYIEIIGNIYENPELVKEDV